MIAPAMPSEVGMRKPFRRKIHRSYERERRPKALHEPRGIEEHRISANYFEECPRRTNQRRRYEHVLGAEAVEETAREQLHRRVDEIVNSHRRAEPGGGEVEALLEFRLHRRGSHTDEKLVEIKQGRRAPDHPPLQCRPRSASATLVRNDHSAAK